MKVDDARHNPMQGENQNDEVLPSTFIDWLTMAATHLAASPLDGMGLSENRLTQKSGGSL